MSKVYFIFFWRYKGTRWSNMEEWTWEKDKIKEGNACQGLVKWRQKEKEEEEPNVSYWMDLYNLTCNYFFFFLLNLVFKYIWLNEQNESWWCTTGHYLHFSGQVCPDGKKGSTYSSMQGSFALVPCSSCRHLEHHVIEMSFFFIWII